MGARRRLLSHVTSVAKEEPERQNEPKPPRTSEERITDVALDWMRIRIFTVSFKS